MKFVKHEAVHLIIGVVDPVSPDRDVFKTGARKENNIKL